MKSQKQSQIELEMYINSLNKKKQLYSLFSTIIMRKHQILLKTFQINLI